MSELFKNALKRNKAPFRADIVGSFLRPKELKEARHKCKQNEISIDKLKEVEDKEIIKLVAKEKDAGLKAVTDGEFRRSWWHLDFMWGLDGVEKKNIEKGYSFNGLKTRAETASLSGKISFKDHPMLKHYAFLKNIAGNDVLARQTIPAPAQFLAELQRAENKAKTLSIYKNQDELLSDIAKAYSDAINAFYKLGCKNLQLDDCTWGMLCDKNYWQARQSEGINVDDIADLYASLSNEAIKNHPKDMSITTHVCRGNYSSTFAASGGYEPIAKVLLDGVNVDGFYLEYDTDRAGDFSPLRFLGNKQVVLGLISSKTGKLEKKEAVIKRIEEATKFVDINQISLSPQCGFASTEEGNTLTEDEQWAKIHLVNEISSEIWK